MKKNEHTHLVEQAKAYHMRAVLWFPSFLLIHFSVFPSFFFVVVVLEDKDKHTYKQKKKKM